MPPPVQARLGDPERRSRRRGPSGPTRPDRGHGGGTPADTVSAYDHFPPRSSHILPTNRSGKRGHSGVLPRKDVRSWRAWGKLPGGAERSLLSSRREIVELCQRGDRSVGQVARDFDLTETAVREWVRQAERDAWTRTTAGRPASAACSWPSCGGRTAGLRQDVDILKRATAFFAKETGELLPVHRGGEVAAAHRQKGVRAAEGLQVRRRRSARGRAVGAARDAELAAQVKTATGVQGLLLVPRVHAQLRAEGKRHSRKRVARLMRQSGLQGRAAKRWKKTTIPDPAAAARADRIRRTSPPTLRSSTAAGTATAPRSRPGRASCTY